MVPNTLINEDISYRIVRQGTFASTNAKGKK